MEFQQLPDEPFYAASIIKVPIKRGEEGRLSLADLITVRPEDRAGGSGVLAGTLDSPRELSILCLC